MMWTMMWLVGSITVIIWLLCRPFYWRIRRVKHLFPLPMIGNCLPSMIWGNVKFMHYLYNKFPEEKYFGFHFFTRPTLFIKDPELIYQITVKDFKHFSSNGLYIHPIRDPAYGNLFFTQGQQWKELRGKITPYFTPVKVKSMLNSIENILSKMNRHIDENIRKNQPIDMLNVISKVTISITYQLTLGLESDTFENKTSILNYLIEYLIHPFASARMVLGVLSPKIYNILRVNILRNYINKYFSNIILSAIDFRKTENLHRQDFFQGLIALLEENQHSEIEYFPDQMTRYNQKEVTGIASGLTFAGVWTTSLTLSYCLYELALHPDIQEKCRNEVLSVIKEAGSGHITADLATSLPYLSAVVKETLRLRPITIALARECTEDYRVPHTDFTIEKGTYILFSSLPIHKDGKYFPEPNVFRPERFLNGADAEFKSGTYFPFSLGPRNCIAVYFARIEVNMILSRLLQTYKFTVCSKTSIPMSYAKLLLLMKPTHGMWLNVQPILQQKEGNK